jgi:hypothetical protein
VVENLPTSGCSRCRCRYEPLHDERGDLAVERLVDELLEFGTVLGDERDDASLEVEPDRRRRHASDPTRLAPRRHKRPEAVTRRRE